MENENDFEGEFMPSSFSAEKMTLADDLRERGPENPEVRESLNTYFAEKESIADGQNTKTANIDVNFDRAELYFVAERKAEADENFAAVCEQAFYEGVSHLYRKAGC